MLSYMSACEWACLRIPPLTVDPGRTGFELISFGLFMLADFLWSNPKGFSDTPAFFVGLAELLVGFTFFLRTFLVIF
jgi:hypothetical protein